MLFLSETALHRYCWVPSLSWPFVFLPEHASLGSWYRATAVLSDSSSAGFNLSTWLVPKSALAPTFPFALHSLTTALVAQLESPTGPSPQHSSLLQPISWSPASPAEIFIYCFQNLTSSIHSTPSMLVHSFQLRKDLILHVIVHLLVSHALLLKLKCCY